MYSEYLIFMLIVVMMSVVLYSKFTKEERSSLFSSAFSDEEKKFINIDTWGQCYKPFLVFDLRGFVLS